MSASLASFYKCELNVFIRTCEAISERLDEIQEKQKQMVIGEIKGGEIGGKRNVGAIRDIKGTWRALK